eukprot:gnl/TRDRNA2_/TRDRNA2_55574_c0_seq1.p1 gnl/TRDRNA2_/TRDRNA2_55574_c0~~gnl/TRDRNA2_/TRDRNA2_55574_c0_seq1.p1  ORF type:complete len:436 (-),score=33.19 gnl/TRDRNA2_/TRDRNA2_55574_c0_seq1:34-1272(-)
MPDESAGTIDRGWSVSSMDIEQPTGGCRSSGESSRGLCTSLRRCLCRRGRARGSLRFPPPAASNSDDTEIAMASTDCSSASLPLHRPAPAAEVGPVASYIAPILAVLSAVLYSANGELLQGIQRTSTSHVSPLLNLLLCHIGGLAFAPAVLGRPPESLSEDQVRRVPLAAGGFSLVLMGYNYVWLRSAVLVPIAVTNVIFQTSIAIIYVWSIVLFDEVCSPIKLLGVFMALDGSALASGIGLRELFSVDHDSVGVALALLAAVGSASYQVLFRIVYSHTKSEPFFLMYFGAWVSLAHISVILPLVVLADLIGFEQIEYPTSGFEIVCTLGSASVAFLVNCLFICTMTWGSPMLLPAASVLSIPVTLVLDVALHGAQTSGLQLLGHGMVIASFVLLTGMKACCRQRTPRIDAQ